MIPRALACAAAALLFAACRGSGERAASGTDEPPPEAGTLPAAGAQPEEQAGVRFAPGLDALQRAVAANEDELARALIRHIESLGPDERVWQRTRAFERILDGRAAVRCLVLELVCEPQPLEVLFPGAQPGAQAWRLMFRGANTSADAIELFPGPATLFSTRTDLGRSGTEASTQETRSFDSLKRLVLAAHSKAEVELARFFLAPPPGQLAVRLDFELELRSGVLQRDGRELPAMRLAVTSVRAARHAADLPEGSLTPAELLALSAGLTEFEALLALAVRTEPGAGGRDLAPLERALVGLPRTQLELWIPALRWLAGPGVPTDVEGLRAWLRGRREAEPQGPQRPQLVLPREPRAPAAERN